MAKEHPRYASTEWPEWQFNEYPMMVYPGAEDQKKPYDSKGKVLPGVIVNNDAEMADALGLELAAAPVKAKVAARLVDGGAGGTQRLATEEDDRLEAIEEATRLGITIDRSWSLARLQDAIDSSKATPQVV